jgi:hypothetical protein
VERGQVGLRQPAEEGAPGFRGGPRPFEAPPVATGAGGGDLQVGMATGQRRPASMSTSNLRARAG